MVAAEVDEGVLDASVDERAEEHIRGGEERHDGVYVLMVDEARDQFWVESTKESDVEEVKRERGLARLRAPTAL